MFCPKERDSDSHIRGLTAFAFTDFLEDLLEKSLEAFSKEGYEQSFRDIFFFLAMDLIQTHFRYPKKPQQKNRTKF